MDIVQVPQLGDDVCIPDYCYTGDDEDVDINVWIGPGGTVSPLHTDPKHNLLCQVYCIIMLNDLMKLSQPRLNPIHKIKAVFVWFS